MLALVLFAIVGVVIKAPIAYWIVYGVYCFLKTVESIIHIAKGE